MRPKPWSFWAAKFKAAKPLALEDLKAELQRTTVCALCGLKVDTNGVIVAGEPWRIFHRECMKRDG